MSDAAKLENEVKPGGAKLDVKLFAAAADGAAVSARDLVPIFHRWIQTSRLDGELLVDVADYAHVQDGPGVLLVAHGAFYSFDGEDGRPGLLYSRRRRSGAADGDNGGGLAGVLRRALVAGRELERDVAGLAFPGGELLLRVNDRLAAVDVEAAEATLRGELAPLLAVLFPDRKVAVERRGEPRERLTLVVRSGEAPGVQALLDRLEAAA